MKQLIIFFLLLCGVSLSAQRTFSIQSVSDSTFTIVTYRPLENGLRNISVTETAWDSTRIINSLLSEIYNSTIREAEAFRQFQEGQSEQKSIQDSLLAFAPRLDLGQLALSSFKNNFLRSQRFPNGRIRVQGKETLRVMVDENSAGNVRIRLLDAEENFIETGRINPLGPQKARLTGLSQYVGGFADLYLIASNEGFDLYRGFDNVDGKNVILRINKQ